MFRSLLIANRGEIACRVMRTARAMGLRVIAVYSEADARAMHVQMADEAHFIGPAPAAESYLRGDKIIAAAQASGAEAIHPGYGFLSENAEFAEAVAAAGIAFVGPPPGAIRAMGLKDAAKALMAKAGVPIVPGYHGDRQEADFLEAEAGRIGYPVLIKAVAGGGGKGMRRVEAAADFAKALEGAQREAKAAFGEPRVLIEKYVTRPRHIEIQVFADRHGRAVSLFERDCSVQRRHQKVIEEAPAPGMPPEMRASMGRAAVEAARAIGYEGAGTVEFIADASEGLRADRYWFMEMNTRLQVEHPVTEFITGLDLVEWQLRVAAGEPLPLGDGAPEMRGHSVEARLYAEDPARNFFPSPGVLEHLRLPAGTGHVRIDTGVREGDEVTLNYDPMIAKIIAYDATRSGALQRLAAALSRTEVAGVKTNAAFLAAILENDAFINGDIDTGFIDRHGKALIPSSEVPLRIYAVAAVHLAFGEAPPKGPWDQQDGFRLMGLTAERSHRSRFEARGGEPVDVDLTFRGRTIECHVGGETLLIEAERAGPGALLVRTSRAGAPAVMERISFARTGRGLAIITGASTYEIASLAPYLKNEDTGTGAREITAPLTGRIVSVPAKVGERVRRGQAVVVLEAMKMEHTLAAEGEAVIAGISAAVGDQVREGQVLVTFADGG